MYSDTTVYNPRCTSWSVKIMKFCSSVGSGFNIISNHTSPTGLFLPVGTFEDDFPAFLRWFMLYSSLEGRYLLEKVSRKVKICCYSLAKKQLFCETNMGKTYWCQDQIHPYIMIYDTQVRHVCHGFAVSLFRMFSRCGTPINFRYEPQKNPALEKPRTQ